jgi:hypothetical protein
LTVTHNPESASKLRVAPAPVAHSLPTETIRSLAELAITDPDLAEVIEHWDQLPEAIRAGIVAMVRASVPSEGHRDSDNSDEIPRRSREEGDR